MGNISSINFQKSKNTFNYTHNARAQKHEPHYFLRVEDRLENYCSCSVEEAIAKFDEAYNERVKLAKKSKLQKNNTRWSAVVNCKESTTIQDLEAVSKHLEEKFGFLGIQISYHKDEGHYDENGEVQRNLHAHLEFLTLTKEGKNNARLLNYFNLRELQTEVAVIMGMERGVDKRISKKIRLETAQYRQEEGIKSKLLEKLKELSNKIALNTPELPQILKIRETMEKDTKKILDSLKKPVGFFEDLFKNIFEQNFKIERQKNLALKGGIKELESLTKSAIIEREEIKNKYLEVKDQNGKLKKENNSLTSINKGLEQDIEILKEKIIEIESNYKKEREALKNSGTATQKDYQELKLKKEESIKLANAPATTEKNEEEEAPLPRMETIEPLSKEFIKAKLEKYLLSSSKEESRLRSTAKPRL